MASVVSNRRGGWEIRESIATPKGPRSKTLATFRSLNDEILERAAERAGRPFDREGVIRIARRVGAEVAVATEERSARTLITQLARGDKISPGLAGALVGYLERSNPPKLSPEAMQAAEWAGVSPADRGRALHDLLLLADALPQGRAGKSLKFPRMIAA